MSGRQRFFHVYISMSTILNLKILKKQKNSNKIILQTAFNHCVFLSIYIFIFLKFKDSVSIEKCEIIFKIKFNFSVCNIFWIILTVLLSVEVFT